MTDGEVAGRWASRGADVFDDFAVEGEPRLICNMNTGLADWETYAARISAVPELIRALQAARAALETAAPSLQLDSEADLLAARALGLIYQLAGDASPLAFTVGAASQPRL